MITNRRANDAPAEALIGMQRKLKARRFRIWKIPPIRTVKRRYRLQSARRVVAD